MSMSNRGLIKAGRRVLVIGTDNRLGSAARSMVDVTWFGPAYETAAAAVAYGKAKFGVEPVAFVKREPVPVAKPAPAPVVEPVEESKPLGILPPPDDTAPKTWWDYTVPVLKAKCKAAGLKGYSKLAKAALVEMLTLAKVAA